MKRTTLALFSFILLSLSSCGSDSSLGTDFGSTVTETESALELPIILKDSTAPAQEDTHLGP